MIKISPASISLEVTALSSTSNSSTVLLALEFKFLKRHKIYQLIIQATKAGGQFQEKQITKLQLSILKHLTS